MIKHAGFFHSSEEKQFSYEYLSGTHLLQTLTKSNNMSLTLSYEDKRDLLTGMAYKRGSTTVASRTYIYDAAGRPITRNTARNGTTVNDSFGYNTRSELTAATVNNGTYSYNYDNIGNRNTAQEITEEVTNYTANNLNQYTAIGDFAPTYDAAGNQTLVKTSTGTWEVTYDAENRPVNFTNAETNTVIECAYDHMGRRATKKVTVDGSITLHQRYLYRGYLQIACCDLTRTNHPCLWLITWDPTQPIATRPLAIQKDGTWYTYGWDLTKNICELYGQHGYIRTNYTYTPYGEVTESANSVYQPIQWSSEFHDAELALVYYNYRHYNPTVGRWLGRDLIYLPTQQNLYNFVANNPSTLIDFLGLARVYFTTIYIKNENLFSDETLATIKLSIDAECEEKTIRGSFIPTSSEIFDLNIREQTSTVPHSREFCVTIDFDISASFNDQVVLEEVLTNGLTGIAAGGAIGTATAIPGVVGGGIIGGIAGSVLGMLIEVRRTVHKVISIETCCKCQYMFNRLKWHTETRELSSKGREQDGDLYIEYM